MIEALNKNNGLLKTLMYSLNETKETKLVRRKILEQVTENMNEISKLKGINLTKETAKIRMLTVRIEKGVYPRELNFKHEAAKLLAKDIEPYLKGGETDGAFIFSVLIGKPIN